ncbi:endolytic transglycosylase MltG, partial [Candidatus Dojkabacteria bacterium]|nr:endolytic transglycosylase MltG [Candidatus Dojkabacteria bacterium]
MKRQVKKKSAFTKIFLGIIFLMIVGLLAIAGLYGWYSYEVSRPQIEGDDGVIYFEVKEGDTRDLVAERLESLNVVKNSDNVVWYVRISGRGGNMQAGNHILRKNMSIKDIVEELEQVPDQETIWVTIPEGLRYDEIATIISDAFSHFDSTVFDKQEFLSIVEAPRRPGTLSQTTQSFLSEYLPEGKSLEGYLYPDTYNFSVDSTASDVVETLVSTLFVKLEPELLDQVDRSEFSLYEILTIASMIEREAFNVEESHMIADIIIRRLEIGYPLGIDATSLYELKDWKATLTFKELEDDNPYNTRINLGLPPTPIANPNVTTIRATLNPTSN